MKQIGWVQIDALCHQLRDQMNSQRLAAEETIASRVQELGLSLGDDGTGSPTAPGRRSCPAGKREARRKLEIPTEQQAILTSVPPSRAREQRAELLQEKSGENLKSGEQAGARSDANLFQTRNLETFGTESAGRLAHCTLEAA